MEQQSFPERVKARWHNQPNGVKWAEFAAGVALACVVLNRPELPGEPEGMQNVRHDITQTLERLPWECEDTAQVRNELEVMERGVHGEKLDNGRVAPPTTQEQVDSQRKELNLCRARQIPTRLLEGGLLMTLTFPVGSELWRRHAEGEAIKRRALGM